MGIKERELVESLSEEEQQSLRRLCGSCCSGHDIPGEHAEKLLKLNLAEMTCGGLGLTSAGRHAAYAFLMNGKPPANGKAHGAASGGTS